MENKKTPEIRFAGFAGDWVEHRLGDVGATYAGLSGKTKKDFGHGDGRYITYTNIFTNPIASENGIESVEIDDSQNSVKYGDVLFTTSSETPEEVGMSSVWLKDIPNVYLNSFCFGYRPILEVNFYYLAYILRSPSLRKKIVFLAQGISRYNISKNRVMDLYLPLPPKKEQAHIGNFFKQLDDTISICQGELDRLKQIKQGFLQKMFPKEGESVPEIRFTGFTCNWEKRAIREVASVAMCKRIFKEQTSETGAIPFYKIGTFGGVPDSFISQGLYNEYRSRFSYPEVGDILISASGTIGRSIIYNGEEAYYQDSNIVWLKCDKKKLSNLFLRQFYEVVSWKGLEGSTIKRLYNDIILSTYIVFPCIEEQIQIGTFFKKLEDVISLKEREINLLKATKKAFLQKMFI